MKKNQDQPADAAELRRRAEERLSEKRKSQRSEGGDQRMEEDTARLVHELQTHQIELEMQNEELQQARAKAGELLAQYTNLYEFAPTGYMILDREGVIRQVNLAGAQLLGVERSRLANRRFNLYVAEHDRSAFNDFLQKVFASEANEYCELTLAQKSSQPRFVRIEGTRTADEQECRAMVLDITDRKRSEEDLRESERRLKEAQVLGRNGYWEYDPTRQMLLWSDQMFVLYERDPALGAPNPEDEAPYYSPEQRQTLQEHVVKALETGIDSHVDLQAKLPSGKLMYYAATMHPIKSPNGRIVKLVGTIQDITERKQSEITLYKVNRAMKILSACNSCLVRATDEKDFLNDVCQIIRKNGEYSMVWIGFIDAAEKDIVRPVAYAGTEPVDYKSVKIDLADPDVCYTMLRSVVANGEFQKRQNLPGDCQPCFGPPWPANRPCRSILSLPLIFDNRTKGALTIYSTRADTFDEQETKLLMELVDDISYGITTMRMRVRHLQAEEQIKMSLITAETALESTVKALGVTSELRDPYTAGHQRRVTQLACAIAREMGFTENRINGVRVAGLLHDIGKILIPAEILTKPSKLTEVEFAIVKTHSRASFDILKSIEFPWPVAQIVIQHHEKLNGSGYPSGLKGDEIIMEARILCVADIVEAMGSHRPYRPALGIDAALDDMKQNRGILYDPAVVDAC
ncbi:MAG: hypothetical protein A2176_06000, partial [Spirochaetes bacterium RBG_13_51_14]